MYIASERQENKGKWKKSTNAKHQIKRFDGKLMNNNQVECELSRREKHMPKPNTIRFDSIRFTLIHFQNEMFSIQLFSL